MGSRGHLIKAVVIHILPLTSQTRLPCKVWLLTGIISALSIKRAYTTVLNILNECALYGNILPQTIMTKRIIISLKISLSGSHLKRIQFFIPWVMARQRQSQQPKHYGKVRKIFYVLDAEFVWIAKSVNVHLWFFSRVLREGFWNKFHSLITKFLVSESFMKITYNLLGKASQCGGIKNIILNSEYSLQNIFCAMYWCAQLLIF